MRTVGMGDLDVNTGDGTTNTPLEESCVGGGPNTSERALIKRGERWRISGDTSTDCEACLASSWWAEPSGAEASLATTAAVLPGDVARHCSRATVATTTDVACGAAAATGSEAGGRLLAEQALTTELPEGPQPWRCSEPVDADISRMRPICCDSRRDAVPADKPPGTVTKLVGRDAEPDDDGAQVLVLQPGDTTTERGCALLADGTCQDIASEQRTGVAPRSGEAVRCSIGPGGTNVIGGSGADGADRCLTTATPKRMEPLPPWDAVGGAAASAAAEGRRLRLGEQSRGQKRTETEADSAITLPSSDAARLPHRLPSSGLSDTDLRAGGLPPLPKSSATSSEAWGCSKCCVSSRSGSKSSTREGSLYRRDTEERRSWGRWQRLESSCSSCTGPFGTRRPASWSAIQSKRSLEGR
mmetsp:Transcript_132325/g.423375  ORF Transcript_132325/g.423375 Transcript_132325/m.423375 type:complete len:414 (+) Transcript_132325:596-1837(+)